MSEGTEKATEVTRVQAFLRQVELDSSSRKQDLVTAQVAVTDLTAKLAEARAELGRHTDELDRLRRKSETDLEESGTRVADLTERILTEHLSTQLEGIGEQISAQYEQRIRSLEAALAQRESEATAAMEKSEVLAREFDEKQRAANVEQNELVSRHQTELQALKGEHAESRATHEDRLTRTEEKSATQVEELSVKHRQELDTLRADHHTARELHSAQHDKIIEKLEVALHERDKLVERANETTVALQIETDRLRTAAEQDLSALREQRRAEREDLEEEVARLRNERVDMKERLESLEAHVGADDTLQRLNELEEERTGLLSTARDHEKLLSGLMDSLSQIKGVCDQSPAARSIIGSGVDLDRVFEALEE